MERKENSYHILGSVATVKVDRPLGSYHPRHPDMYYPVNYGYVEGIIIVVEGNL